MWGCLKSGERFGRLRGRTRDRLFHQPANMLVRAHLRRALLRIRGRSPAGLTPQLRRARERQLVELARYREMGRFPRNEVMRWRRTPVFVGPEGNRCAVAHLLECSGQAVLVEQVQQTANLARIRDLPSDRLEPWAASVGLELQELAWIQPHYFSSRSATGPMVQEMLRVFAVLGPTLWIWVGVAFWHLVLGWRNWRRRLTPRWIAVASLPVTILLIALTPNRNELHASFGGFDIFSAEGWRDTLWVGEVATYTYPLEIAWRGTLLAQAWVAVTWLLIAAVIAQLRWHGLRRACRCGRAWSANVFRRECCPQCGEQLWDGPCWRGRTFLWSGARSPLSLLLVLSCCLTADLFWGLRQQAMRSPTQEARQGDVTDVGVGGRWGSRRVAVACRGGPGCGCRGGTQNQGVAQIYVDNNSADPIEVELDGAAARRVAPWGILRRTGLPGAHTVRVLQGSQVIWSRKFETVANSMYFVDPTGIGRYDVWRLGYSRPLDPGGGREPGRLEASLEAGPTLRDHAQSVQYQIGHRPARVRCSAQVRMLRKRPPSPLPRSLTWHLLKQAEKGQFDLVYHPSYRNAVLEEGARLGLDGAKRLLLAELEKGAGHESICRHATVRWLPELTAWFRQHRGLTSGRSGLSVLRKFVSLAGGKELLAVYPVLSPEGQQAVLHSLGSKPLADSVGVAQLALENPRCRELGVSLLIRPELAQYPAAVRALTEAFPRHAERVRAKFFHRYYQGQVRERTETGTLPFLLVGLADRNRQIRFYALQALQLPKFARLPKCQAALQEHRAALKKAWGARGSSEQTPPGFWGRVCRPRSGLRREGG